MKTTTHTYVSKLSKVLFFFLLITTLYNCSGIKLPSNCGKNNDITFIVLPFVNDDYYCHINIEHKLKSMCYKVLNGDHILRQYCNLTNKSLNEISITEFSSYAKQQGITNIIYGDVKIVWLDGKRPQGRILPTATSSNLYGSFSSSLSNEEDLYNIVTGNYANLTCHSINTETLEIKEVFYNYTVKKVPLGLPTPVAHSD